MYIYTLQFYFFQRWLSYDMGWQQRVWHCNTLQCSAGTAPQEYINALQHYINALQHCNTATLQHCNTATHCVNLTSQSRCVPLVASDTLLSCPRDVWDMSGESWVAITLSRYHTWHESLSHSFVMLSRYHTHMTRSVAITLVWHDVSCSRMCVVVRSYVAVSRVSYVTLSFARCMRLHR